jgi:hypothetical protein
MEKIPIGSFSKMIAVPSAEIAVIIADIMK